MISNKTTALLGSLLLLAAVVPLTTAHLTGPSATSDALTGDSYRSNGDTPTSHDGVSGTYYGPAGAYIISPALFGTTNPFVAGAMLCDAEVAGTGASPSPQDEQTVDDQSGGLVPDGTFDDGGQGGACHTQGHYEHPGYDTPGCDGTAFAKDAVSGGDVWIAAVCDWKATDTGPGLATCVVNEVLGWDLNNPASIVPGIANCASNFDDGGGTFQSCGSDGVGDSIDFNHGSSGADFINDSGTDSCGGQEAAGVFVFEYVEESLLASTASHQAIVPAVAGWIDNVIEDASTECTDGADNDSDGETDEDDRECRIIIDVAGVTIISQYNPADDSESPPS